MKSTDIHVGLVNAGFFVKLYMNPSWLSKFCLLLLCSFMHPIEHNNAITDSGVSRGGIRGVGFQVTNLSGC